MDALIGTFHIDWKLVVAQLFNFAIVFGVLYWFALRPLAKLMSERGEKISKGLSDAETNQKLVEDAKKLYDAELARARKDAQALTATMEQEVAKKRASLVASASEEVNKMLDDGKKKLIEEKESVLKQAEKEIASLVVMSVEKVLAGSMDDTARKHMVAKAAEHITK